MKKFWYTSILQVVLAMWLVGPSLAESKVVDRIVAIVNTEVIMLSELETRMAPLVQQVEAANLPDEEKQKVLYQAREEMLHSMVSAVITRQEGEKLGVKVLDGEIDSYIERFKQASSLTDETLRAQLKKEGLTMEMLRGQIRDTILFTKLKNTNVDSKIVITEQEIKDYYAGHEAEYAGKKSYHLRYILLPFPENATQKDKDNVAKTMDQILVMYKGGDAFPDLIKKASAPEIGGSGGDLGLFAADELTKELAEQVVEMEAGDVTLPMNVDDGLQVFWLEKIQQAEGRSLEEATEEIQMLLYNSQVQEKHKEWVTELEKASYVKIIR